MTKHVVVDERLVTGQNPESASECAMCMCRLLGAEVPAETFGEKLSGLWQSAKEKVSEAAGRLKQTLHPQQGSVTTNTAGRTAARADTTAAR